MTSLKRKSIQVLLFVIIFIGAIARILAYGDFRLSAANADTASYIESSRAPLFSWKMFAGKRMFTTNLIYKFANDPVACPLNEFSNPSIGLELPRERQVCFEKITALQNILSILAWSFLAWITSRWLKTPLFKILSVILILSFAFTPQIAEWDYVLSPESTTFSLLVISFALMQEVCLRMASSEGFIASRSAIVLISIWLIAYFLWVFIRDVHIYAVFLTVALLLILFVFKQFRRNKVLVILVISLVGIFLLGWKSASDSLRATHDPLLHSFQVYILPYPSRVDFMKQFGIPDSESAEFRSWLDANATRSFGLFLISHPGFVMQTLWDSLPYFASDFEQAYFPTKDIRFRDDLIKIGQLVHPETMAIYLIDALIWIAFVIKTIRHRTAESLAWAWLATWFFLSSILTLGPSFFGDTVGTRRHIFPSVEMFRLFLWLFLLPHLDAERKAVPDRTEYDAPAIMPEQRNG